MNEVPNKLTTEEWNFLQNLTEYTKMDTWFMLTEIEDGKKDAVYDLDYEKVIPLEEGLVELAENLVYDNLKMFDRGIEIWDGIMDKFCGGAYKYE